MKTTIVYAFSIKQEVIHKEYLFKGIVFSFWFDQDGFKFVGLRWKSNNNTVEEKYFREEELEAV
jgi:hypothetical protein